MVTEPSRVGNID